MKLRELINCITHKVGGQGVLAEMAGCQQSELSKFMSNQGNLGLAVLEKIIEAGDVTTIPRQDMKDIEITIKTITKFWERADVKLNRAGGK